MNNRCLAGKVLYVDLSTRKISDEPAVDYIRRFLGGRGVNNWLLYTHTRANPKISPLDPGNVLVFGTGSLVGTLAPCSSRLNIVAKSPVTNGIGSASVGGYFSAALRFAGYDHLVFTGRSKELCYVWIEDNKVEIRDASNLKGKTTGETEYLIRQELGHNDVRIASIGPAGENLVMAACIIVDRYRAAARCGLGAVMGSKNLKAIAARGTGPITVEDEKRFNQLVQMFLEKAKNSVTLQRFAWGGTPAGEPGNETNPFKHFQDGHAPGDMVRKIQSELPSYISREDKEKGAGCWNCPVKCAHYYKIQDGAYKGTELGKLEENSVIDFCYQLGIEDVVSPIRATALCSEYGLDVDNAGIAIAWAFECYQRGIISKQDTDGLELEWGNHKVVMDLLHKIAYRIGFGDILGRGSREASKMVGKGSWKYSIHIKGQDLKETLRTWKSWALGVVVSERGGAHTRGAPLVDLLWPPEMITRTFGRSAAGGPTSYEGKPKMVVYYDKFHAILDSLGMCYFMSNWVGANLPNPDEYSKLFSAATGINMSSEELMRMGERITNMGKVLNILYAGFGRKDDYPPERLMEEPIKTGPYKGERLEKQKWEKMLDEYYELHGWDTNGWPTARTLRQLELKEMERDLNKVRKNRVF